MNLKTSITTLILLITIILTGYSQNFSPSDNSCDFKVTIVKDRYLFGKAFLQQEGVRRIKVNFTSKLVNVWVPFRKKSILLAIENSNCQAYCPRVKRVRQLHSGDERLLIKLLKRRKKSLMNQLSACSF